MTQEQLAVAVGTDKGVISLLESGSRGLSDKWLRRLAPILETSPGHLLDHDPENLPTDIIDIWSRIADDDKPTAKRVLESFRKTG
jgi:transcriptional regulator with XRE-family HTH domain